MASKITGREYGLEFGTIALNYFFKSKALHYGFWKANQDVEIWNFGDAQTNYTENIIKNIPAGVKSVLDVGCGTGIIAKAMINAGYHVECISPSSYLAKEVRDNIDGIQVYECKFEDFAASKKYDLILFSESFQYIDIHQVFIKSFQHLNEGGFVLLSDIFKLHKDKRGPIGGGHNYQEYLKICKGNNLELVSDQDISENIAPTFDILHDFSTNLLKPIWDNFLRVVSVNKPLVFKLAKWKFNHKLERMNRHFKPDRNGKGFLEYNTYRVMVWKRRTDQ